MCLKTDSGLIRHSFRDVKGVESHGCRWFIIDRAAGPHYNTGKTQHRRLKMGEKQLEDTPTSRLLTHFID